MCFSRFFLFVGPLVATLLFVVDDFRWFVCPHAKQGKDTRSFQLDLSCFKIGFDILCADYAASPHKLEQAARTKVRNTPLVAATTKKVVRTL